MGQPRRQPRLQAVPCRSGLQAEPEEGVQPHSRGLPGDVEGAGRPVRHLRSALLRETAARSTSTTATARARSADCSAVHAISASATSTTTSTSSGTPSSTCNDTQPERSAPAVPGASSSRLAGGIASRLLPGAENGDEAGVHGADEDLGEPDGIPANRPLMPGRWTDSRAAAGPTARPTPLRPAHADRCELFAAFGGEGGGP